MECRGPRHATCAPPDGNGNSPFINVDPDKARRLWALDSRRGQQPGTGRVALWTAELDDEEAAPRWTSVGTVVRWRGDAGGHEDFSSPWMARVEDHRWLLVFYSGDRRGRSDLFALDLELDPATGRATATSVTPDTSPTRPRADREEPRRHQPKREPRMDAKGREG